MRVSFGDRTYEMSFLDFLQLVDRSLDGVLGMGQNCCRMANLGYVDAAGQDEALARLLLDALRTVGAHCTDAELRALLESLYPLADRLVGLGGQLVAEAARFVSLPPPQGKRDRRKLERRLAKESKAAGPRWMYQSAFQLVGDQAGWTYAAESRIARQVQARLAALRAEIVRPAGEAVGQEALYLLLAGALGRTYYATNSLDYRFRANLPDVGGAWTVLVRDVAEELGTLGAQITDLELHEPLEALRAEAERMVELADRVLTEVARFVGLAAPRSEQDRERLRSRLAQYDAVGPAWAEDAAFRRAAYEASMSGYHAVEIEQSIEARVRELRASNGPAAAAGR